MFGERFAQLVAIQIPIRAVGKHEERLFAEIQEDGEENPQGVQEMPVVGRDTDCGLLRNVGAIKFAKQNKEQCADTAEDVDCVGAGKNIEKTAGGIAGYVDALSDELAPDDELAGKEEQT